MKPNSEIKELTGIRFFAAIHVIFFHNFYLTGDTIKNVPQWIMSAISYGDCAVTFFFILSGFILTYVYSAPDLTLKMSKKKFILARFSRIYPIYFFALLMDLPRGLTYFFDKFDLNTALQKIGLSVSAHLAMVQSWHPRLTPAWNPPAWSLSTEMFFYLMAPVAIPFVLKSKRTLLPMILLYAMPIAVYFLLINGLGSDFDQTPAGSVFWRSFPLLRFTEFLTGIFLGKLLLKEDKTVTWLRENQFLTSVLFWGSLILSVILISGFHQFYRSIFASVFLVPLFSLMILAIASTQVSLTGFLRMKFTLLLGGASYALYMIHIPILTYVSFLFRKFNVDYSFRYFTGYLLISIIVSIVLFKLLELPAQNWIRARINSSGTRE